MTKLSLLIILLIFPMLSAQSTKEIYVPVPEDGYQPQEVELYVKHRIVTHNSPKARDLKGNLKFEVLEGDQSLIEVKHTFSNNGESPNTIIPLASTIDITEPGHSGCGDHTWHEGYEGFSKKAIGQKTGKIRVKATVNPTQGSSEKTDILDIYVFKVEFVTPSGAPVTSPNDTGEGQNEFTFSNETKGKLDFNAEIKILPEGQGLADKIKDKITFEVDPIGASTFQWKSSYENGKPTASGSNLKVECDYTGMPQRNSDFGYKAVRVNYSGNKIAEQWFAVFFDKWAFNSPGSNGGKIPNWFYYWKDGGVCGLDLNNCVYEAQQGTGLRGYTKPGTDTIIRVCQLAAETNPGPQSFTSNAGVSISVKGYGKGIKSIAELIEHERHHLTIYNTNGNIIIGAKPINDIDGDAIRTVDEPTLDGVSSDPNNPDTYNIGYGNYNLYGDNEVRCRKIELILTVNYDTQKDWAKPGTQSKEKFGP